VQEELKLRSNERVRCVANDKSPALDVDEIGVERKCFNGIVLHN